MSATTDVPEGFETLQRSSPFLDMLVPIYSRRRGDDLIVAIRAEQKHCNARGYLHGGVFCTLADIALGYNAALAANKSTGMVTTNLSIDYAGSAKVGDWVEIDVDVQKVGSTLAFANCYFSVDGKRIARASAIFCKPGGASAA